MNYIQDYQKQTQNTRKQVDPLVYKLYNPTPEGIKIVEGYK